MAAQRYQMTDLITKFPDQWVILDDVEWENRSTVKSGVLVGVCSDRDMSGIRMKNRRAGKKYIYRRTSEGLVSPYIHAVDFEVTT